MALSASQQIMDTLPGKQLDEYRIEQLLGAGGMARVYRALDIKLLRYVALKVIAPIYRDNADLTARFEQEAQSIARLEHPNIVHIYRFGEASGLYYMAMQYIEGADVAWLIRSYKANHERMPINDIVNIVADIGAALDYAHGKGTIHRDVKPGNIIVDSEGHAILTDFGLAVLEDAAEEIHEFQGSPHYMSPEQAIPGGKVGPESDIYSLGVTLYEMLTGQVPFTGGNPMEVAAKHTAEPPQRPSQIEAGIPPALDNVVLRCLNKDPRVRFRTGAELTAALRTAVASWEPSRRSNSGTSQFKVSQRLATAPLPPLPATPPPPGEAPSLPSFMLPPRPESAATLRGAPPAVTSANAPLRAPILPGAVNTRQAIQPGYDLSPSPVTAQPDYTPAAGRSRLDWRLPGIIITGLVLLMLAACLVLFGMAARGMMLAKPGSPTRTPLPTSTPLPPSITPMPPGGFPTTAPIAPVATTAPIVPPTSAATSAPPALPAAPPENRNAPPANSQRLGDFTVEYYCNNRGLGVSIVNNNADWACLNADGSIAFLLTPTDFDTICRERYLSQNAFAIRDQQKPEPAYNWSCYEYTSG